MERDILNRISLNWPTTIALTVVLAFTYLTGLGLAKLALLPLKMATAQSETVRHGDLQTIGQCVTGMERLAAKRMGY